MGFKGCFRILGFKREPNPFPVPFEEKGGEGANKKPPSGGSCIGVPKGINLGTGKL